MEEDVEKRRLRVLIIDDDPFIIKVVRVMLKVHGMEVFEAPNGTQGLAATKELLPDVVLLDIMMPDLNGFEVCKAIRLDDETREIPIIFVSAVTAPEQIKKGLSLGAQGYLTKPFETDGIVSKIQEVTNSKPHE